MVINPENLPDIPGGGGGVCLLEFIITTQHCNIQQTTWIPGQFSKNQRMSLDIQMLFSKNGKIRFFKNQIF
jgi:hypothetical protein